MTKRKDLVPSFGPTINNTKANGKMVNNMESDTTHPPTALNPAKESGLRDEG